MLDALIIPFREHHAADRYGIGCELRQTVGKRFASGDQREKTETNFVAKPAHGAAHLG
jgi:hypothetical protein